MDKYTKLTVEQYLSYVSANLKRTITELHRHHTWLPNYDTWEKSQDKKQIMLSMETYHVKTRGFADIAQNATLDPDGFVWVCRDLNTDPASITGHNKGAWCLEMIGDFDTGKDKMTEVQNKAMVKIFKGMIGLTGAVIVDHNEFSSKTCPGTSLPKKDLLDAIYQKSDWKQDNALWLYKNGFTSQSHDGYENVDYGTLGAIIRQAKEKGLL